MLITRAKPWVNRLYSGHTLCPGQAPWQLPILWQSSSERMIFPQPATTRMRFSTANALLKGKRKKKKEKSTQKSTQKPTVDHSPGDPGDSGLSEEQKVILDMVVRQGKSVFFTGPAGTGKSVLVRKIVSKLSQKYCDDPKQVAVTASTGMAAFSLGGTTLHRFAGIGLGQAPIEKLIADISQCPYKSGRWLTAKVLVIDEISMVSAALFDKLDLIAQRVRYNRRPFGGLQLVVTGDFFQLPPVIKGAEDGSPRFCFQAESWKRAIPNTMNLTTIYRQKDPNLTRMLNEIREGEPSEDTIKAIKGLDRPLQWGPRKVTDATELFPTRRGADAANSRRLESLNGPTITYAAVEGGSISDPMSRKRLLSDCIAPENVYLRVGAQVVLVKNLDADLGLVNGLQGHVIDFADDETFRNGPWTHGSGDVIKSDGRVSRKQTRRLRQKDSPADNTNLYPVVNFSLRDGNTHTVLCKPTEWSVSQWTLIPAYPEPEWHTEVLATRVQIPLIPAWALSIHKSQGQTLDRVKVDLGQTFEDGQAYVALSRVTGIDGLQVLNFDPSKVRAHPAVKQFYSELSRAPTLSTPALGKAARLGE